MSKAVWQHLAETHAASEETVRLWKRRADAILEGCTSVQRTMILDPADYKSARCPRRSGKSHGATSYALWVGENFPGSRVLILGLTLKSAKENYWSYAPGGIQALDRKFDLHLHPNATDYSWRHENGSVGYLAGAETAADLERLRGSKVEVDLVIVDECKSFSPYLLETLINDILMPGLMTRNGKILLIGTPGSIPEGIFYAATCERSRTQSGTPTCLNFRTRAQDATALSDEDVASCWSLHTWTLQDNTAKKGQWERALRDKRRKGWADDHPSWRREFLGEWVTDSLDLVYHRYAAGLEDGRVSWVPDLKSKEPHGLPEDGGPWHYVYGLDLGFEDDTAVVVLAYGEHDGNLYHIDEWKEPHLHFDDVDRLLKRLSEKYPPSIIVYDEQAKQLGQSLADRGHPVVAAEKKEKFDFIELLNSEFAEGRVKILRGSELHHELTGLQYDLSAGAKQELVRKGRLKEDVSCPNHLCDAILYAWRWSYHSHARQKVKGPEIGTREYFASESAREKAEFIARSKADAANVRFGQVDHFATRARFNFPN